MYINILFTYYFTVEQTQSSGPAVVLQPAAVRAPFSPSLHPLARVGSERTAAVVARVQEPATDEVVVLRAETTTHSTRDVTNVNDRAEQGVGDAADALVPLVHLGCKDKGAE